MNTSRTAAAVSLAGLLMGAVALPVSALLHNTDPATRAGVTVPGPQVAKAAVPRPTTVLVIAHRGFSDSLRRTTCRP